MSKFVVLMLLLLAAVAVIAAIKRRGRKRPSSAEDWPVYAKKVLTAPEQMLFDRLRRAYPEKVVLAQVALPAFLGVKKGANFHAWYNRFGRLIADFVVCERDFRVIAVIELDDRSHDHPRRQDADGRKAAALEAAGIPLHRVNVNPLPNEEDLIVLLQDRRLIES